MVYDRWGVKIYGGRRAAAAASFSIGGMYDRRSAQRLTFSRCNTVKTLYIQEVYSESKYATHCVSQEKASKMPSPLTADVP